jgi:hypothetical protein
VSSVSPVQSGTASQFLYDTDDGYMWFDVDGVGASAPNVFAAFSNLANILASDFEVIV